MATIESYETAGGKRYQVRYRTPQRTQTKKRGFKTLSEMLTALAATVEVREDVWGVRCAGGRPSHGRGARHASGWVGRLI